MRPWQCGIVGGVMADANILRIATAVVLAAGGALLSPQGAEGASTIVNVSAALMQGVAGNFLHQSLDAPLDALFRARRGIDENHTILLSLRKAHLEALNVLLDRCVESLGCDDEFCVDLRQYITSARKDNTPNKISEPSDLERKILTELPNALHVALASRVTHEDGSASVRSYVDSAILDLLRVELEVEIPGLFVREFLGQSGSGWYDLFVLIASSELKKNDAFQRIWVAEQLATIRDGLNVLQKAVNHRFPGEAGNARLMLRGFDDSLGNDIHRRREVIGKPASWQFVRQGRYVRRAELISDLSEKMASWLDRNSSASESEYPVFWLDGRSGDGKSVALLQTVERYLIAHPDAIIEKIDDLSKFVDAVGRLSGLTGDRLIVVDDLFKLGDRESVAARLYGYLHNENARPVPIVTCGPSPERNEFQRIFSDVFNIEHHIVRGPSSQERREFCDWLGLSVPAHSRDDDILVEFLFELNVGEPIKNFTKNFRQRMRAAAGELEHHMLAVLAVNALDLSAHPSLLKDDMGRNFVERLKWDDQRHFTEVLFSDGSPGIRFSHTRIAWRVFDAWSEDPRTQVSIDTRFAQAIATNILALQLQTSLRNEIISKVVKNRMEIQLKLKTQTNILDLINDIVGGYSDAYIPFLGALFVQCNMSGCPCDSNRILDAARRVLRPSEQDARGRASLASAWLVRTLSERPARAADASVFVRTLLFDSRMATGAANAFVYLAARHDTSAEWRKLLVLWLEKFPQLPQAWLALEWCLASSNAEGTIERAITWLDANMDAMGASNIISSLLKVSGQNERISQKAMEWLRKNKNTAGSQNVVAGLLAACGHDKAAIDLAYEWLDLNMMTPGSQNVVVTLMTNCQNSPRVIDLAISWINVNIDAPGSQNVVSRLVNARPKDSEVISTAVRWIDINIVMPGSHEVVASLLQVEVYDPGVEKIIERWLSENEKQSGIIEVMAQQLALGAVKQEDVQRAVEFVRANLKVPNTAKLICVLIENRNSGLEIYELAYSWFEENPKEAAGGRIWEALLDVLGNDENLRIRSLEWIRVNIREPAGAPVLQKLMRIHVRDAVVREGVLLWLRANPVLPGGASLISNLLGYYSDDRVIIDRAFEWISANEGAGGCSVVLDGLIGSVNLKDENLVANIENIIKFKFESAAASTSAFRLIVKSAEQGCALSDCFGYFNYVGDEKSKIRHRGDLLAESLRKSDPNEIMIDLLLAFTSGVGIPSAFGSRIPIASRAATLAADVVVAAANRREEDARNLLYPIAKGASFLEEGGERLLDLWGTWPRPYMHLYWRAVISCKHVNPATYLDHLAAYLRGGGQRSSDVIRSLAHREDYDEVFARRLPKVITGKVRHERQTLAKKAVR